MRRYHYNPTSFFEITADRRYSWLPVPGYFFPPYSARLHPGLLLLQKDHSVWGLHNASDDDDPAGTRFRNWHQSGRSVVSSRKNYLPEKYHCIRLHLSRTQHSRKQDSVAPPMEAP